MLRNAVLLVNPAAGSGSGVDMGRVVGRTLRDAGADVVEIVCDSRQDAVERVSAAITPNTEALVTCGGDGTISAALEILADRPVALGVVAAGSGNDFARTLGLPMDDPAAAAAVILRGGRRPVDVGVAGGRRFATILTCGLDSKVNERYDRLRWRHRRSRYLAAILAELARFRPLPFELTVDGERSALSGTLIAVGNGRFYGNGVCMCPAASLTDGLLDVTVVSAISRATLARLWPSTYRGEHVRHPAVRTFRTPEITIDAPGGTAYADGELAGRLPISVSVRPSALDVFA